MAGAIKTLSTAAGLVTGATKGLVDYADVQATAAASVLLGRGAAAGAGTVEEITLGTGLSMTGTVLSSSGGTSYTDEQAQDAVGAMAASSARVTLTYVDTTPSLTADLVADSITAGYLHATATDVLFGRSSAGAGAGQEIACTAFARSLLDDVDAAAARATLGVAGGIVGVALGGTGADLSATGGANKLVKQVTVGGAFTIATMVASDMPVFVAAGAGSARGAAPDPGSTAHANQPRVLGDGAAWVKHSGKFLDKSIVLTDQSTASTTPTNLATQDTITFTVDETTLVCLDWLTEYYVTGTAGNLKDEFVITSSSGATPPTSTMYRQPSATALSLPLSASMRDVLSFPVGTFTVKVQHSINTGTGHWRNRTLTAQIYS